MASGGDVSTQGLRPIGRALLSVSDKTGLVVFARALAGHGVALLSTGGSALALRASGLTVVDVSSHTGHPEILAGRVKTLHPKIHGGILARRDNAGDWEALAAHSIAPIDLVVVNLYPFVEIVARQAESTACIDSIDIGGPALIRAAAKNHADVAVVTDPDAYAALLAELDAQGGALSAATRRRLAATAFAHTAAYDAAIAAWFADREATMAGENAPWFPETLSVIAARRQTLRYGENPHQRAALYVGGPARPGVATARQVQGKELSYNNLNDTDAAFELVAEFERPAVAIIKHANPCGVAEAEDLTQAYKRALACDPVSAFGGIIAVNRRLDADTAVAIGALFAEVVIAPGADTDALALLSAKKNLRVLLTSGMPDPTESGSALRSLAGGYLLQDRDRGRVGSDQLEVVTRRAPSEEETSNLLFAFRVCKHVKSNAIVFARGGATVGIGAGQMSRVDSARMAALKAADAAMAADEVMTRTHASVVASDAFFPFPDGLLTCLDAGASAVIQPGGSVRDDEVVAAADSRGAAMVFARLRHFRH